MSLSSIIMVIINNKIFDFNPFIYNEFVFLKEYPNINPNFYSEELISLYNLSRSIENHALVAIANPECKDNEEIKNFSYSALLEARIWNECHMYNRKTKGGMYKIVNMFKDIDYPKKQDPSIKYEIAYNFAYNDNLSKIECSNIISKYKWSYMLVNRVQIRKIGTCLVDHKYIEDGNYILYEF